MEDSDNDNDPRRNGEGTARTLRAAVASLLLVAAAALAGPSERFDHGLLWEVSRPGVAASHIFGTVHVPDVRLLPLPEPVLDALARSRTFSLEHRPNQQAALLFFEGGQLDNGRRLDHLLDPETFHRLAALTTTRGLPVDVLSKMKPWAALLAVTSLGEADGLHSVDRDLYLRARARRLQIEELDSVDEQISAFDGIPEASQVALLRFAIEYRDQLHRVAERTLGAYLERDLAALAQAGSPLHAQDPAIMPHHRVLEKKLIQDRSVTMTHRMQSQLRYGAAFIAVGAMHLYGENGILALLVDEGWSVRRLY